MTLSSLSLQRYSRAFVTTLHPLAKKDFSIFWAGAFLSSLGFWIQTVGQGWQVLQLTNSAFLLGLVTLMATLPNVFFCLFGGVLVDRWNRRYVLICTQAVYMLSALSLGIATTLHIVTVWHIIIVALINGMFSSIGLPAWQTFVTDLVPLKDLKQGVALDFMQNNLSRVIGPAIGGFSIGLAGIAGSYYLNALSYIAVLIPLLLIHNVQRRNSIKQQSMWQGLREGFRYVGRHSSLQIALFLQFMLVFLVFPFTTLMPIFARDIFHVGASGLGIMNATVGCGAFLGAVLFLVISPYVKRNLRLMVLLCITGGCASVVLGLTSNINMALLVLPILGLCTVMPLAVTNTAIQLMTPVEMRGRVLSIRILITFGLAPFGNLLAGWLAQNIGAQLTLGICGVLCALVSLVVTIVQTRRGIELRVVQS